MKLGVLLISLSGSLLAQATGLDFNRDIRPILSDKCYRCHGPDADNQKSDFRLNTREAALADLGGYAGIVPGDVKASELHFRIWEDVVEEDLMPPSNSKLSLSEAEKKSLDRWIAEGAPYDQHWSFKPITQAALPELTPKNQSWVGNEIDYFVAARLQEEGMEPSQSASKETLIRRVTLDLTGLPPTPEEVDTFLADKSPRAWAQVVDRLLASPHYGERMALVWLDAARYADSGCYQNDMRRSQWPWRDWVIRAYNQNMPFDEFTIEQLAGDLLPNATNEQRLASAFNRNHRINNEGGIVPEEYLVEYVADRVETTSTVWMGLTLTCARCHDHKYDPISQKDFYEMFAFFNNIPENGKDGDMAPKPNMVVYTNGTEAEHLRLKETIAQVKQQIKELPKKRQAPFEAWLDEQRESRKDTLLALSPCPLAALHFPLDTRTDRATANVGANSQEGVFRGRGAKDTSLVDKTTYGSGIQFGTSGFIKVSEPHKDGFNSSDPRSWLVQIKSPKTFAGSEGPLLACVEEVSLRGYRLMLEDAGTTKNFRISFQLMNNTLEKEGIEVVSEPIIAPESHARIGVTWDGSNKATGVSLFVDGKRVGTTMVLDNLKANVGNEEPLLIGARSEQDAIEALRDATFLKGIIDDVQVYDECLSAGQIAFLSNTDPQNLLFAHLNEAARKSLQTAWIQNDDEGKRLVSLLNESESARGDFEDTSVAEVSIMEELPEPRETYLLRRGAYDQPDKSEVLKPSPPDALLPMDKTLPRNRLGLAKWLVDPKNPLPARVAVNRYWQMYFGTGLVRTPEDFGSQGESPSHPRLLDWLAGEFIKSGWNVKAMQKRIVMSATYRQTSFVTPELIEKDPENRLLARGPRFRLDGQQLRDQALAVSGLLEEPIGGPPVMPYQPEGLWDEVSAKGYKYIVGKGEDLYRRSLYTFWRRTVPPPSMMNFDNSAREACSVRASRTNTPLQALNLMNDPQFFEAARALAERMILEGGKSTAEQIAYGHRVVLARTPEPGVLRILEKSYDHYLNTYQTRPEEARKLIHVGSSPPDTRIDPAELAAMTTVSNLLLNLDETLTKE